MHKDPNSKAPLVAGAVAILGLLSSCDSSTFPSPAPTPSTTPGASGPFVSGTEEGVASRGPLRPLAGEKLGDPIPGLTPAELASFERGEVLFNKRFTPDDGLGPLYNATSCASCHSTPVPGGSANLYRNFYIAMIEFEPTNQVAIFGLPSPVIPSYGGGGEFSLEHGRALIPQQFIGFDIVSGQRNAIPIFGTGLFEFITNATIIANSDPVDTDGDGISGRPNIDFGDLGRFGVKAQANNIERFTRPPLRNQMGITSDPFLGSAGTISSSSLAPQGTVNPDLPLTDTDSVPDPEISHEDLGDLLAFTRFLAPPDRLPFDAQATAGEQLFDAIGCAKCHIPSLESSLGPVEAYTDLLMHDMGPELADGLNLGEPSPLGGGMFTGAEFRTQPLWGVALHAPFLHDGRAKTLEDAVELHGGEGQASRDAFVALTKTERDSVLSFLRHL